MSAEAIKRRWGRVQDFHLFGPWGFVSDDTELSALAWRAMEAHPEDHEACAAAFRRGLAFWILSLPWGVGLATLRAGALCILGLKKTGIFSAGNGPVVRAPVIGAFFKDDPVRRRAFSQALALATHTDPRAVAAAAFAADVAAACALGEPLPISCGEPEVDRALIRAHQLARKGAGTAEAAAALGNTGFAVHTVGLAYFLFERFGDTPMDALTEACAAGGDTDSIAAVLGGWLGAGGARFPPYLLARLRPGPYNWPMMLIRHVALYPVVIAHGIRRLFPG